MKHQHTAPASLSGPAVSIEEACWYPYCHCSAEVEEASWRVDQVLTKDLVGGKWTSQNKILGDLQQEFASTPDKGEELSHAALGGSMEP